jgi:hypothetical protein
VLRPVLEDMSTDLKRQHLAMTACRRLILLHSYLPPLFSHHLFNHLIGLARDRAKTEKLGSIDIMALVLPVAAALAPSVNELSVRDMRKNKVEYLFIASGSFWFNEPAPPTFPRFFPGDVSTYRRLTLTPSILNVATIRTAQSSLISAYLQENPREAYGIKKMVESLSLPIMGLKSVQDSSPRPTTLSIELGRVNRQQQDLETISLLVARSWLIMLLRLMAGLNRHYNDRPEIARLFDSLNRILDVHGDNTSLVGQALHICMLATTRFRRLFSSSDGFSLFIPVLFKCFCGARKNPPLRHAIIYAFKRFFHIHEESFVFQAIGSMAQVVNSTEKVQSEMVADVFALLESLSRAPPTQLDLAGIVGINDAEERQSFIHMINDRYAFCYDAHVA